MRSSIITLSESDALTMLRAGAVHIDVDLLFFPSFLSILFEAFNSSSIE